MEYEKTESLVDEGETLEACRQRLDGEIGDLAGVVEHLEFQYTNILHQSGIVARNSREHASRGMLGSNETSKLLDQAGDANSRLRRARQQLDNKRKELANLGKSRQDSSSEQALTWNEWFWSWMGYQPTKK
ncbi:MAG: hypothetical protein CYPHOPRED_000866 [Cyphobasidiales sp. Tagirdzhanova-0007]|nr:MAG: hypothetical protein CYPHOPRED_000866 [Cyphobasidiales sp. Tagirdzhanova-0007]